MAVVGFTEVTVKAVKALKTSQLKIYNNTSYSRNIVKCNRIDEFGASRE